MLNFHLDWFSTLIYLNFHVSLFSLEISYLEPIFRFLGVNKGHISIFHFITHKRHILARVCVFWSITRQNQSRGLFSLRWSEKKKSKSHKKLYFTRLRRRPPWMDFHQIWNSCFPCRHNQSWQIVCQSIQRFGFYRGSNFFPHRKLTSPLKQCCAVRWQ